MQIKTFKQNIPKEIDTEQYYRVKREQSNFSTTDQWHATLNKKLE